MDYHVYAGISDPVRLTLTWFLYFGAFPFILAGCFWVAAEGQGDEMVFNSIQVYLIKWINSLMETYIMLTTTVLEENKCLFNVLIILNRSAFYFSHLGAPGHPFRHGRHRFRVFPEIIRSSLYRETSTSTKNIERLRPSYRESRGHQG